MNKDTISWKERICYGLGDTASCLTFQTISLYLMYFYTDVVGIAPAALATLFLVMRLWDGVNDPLMGIIIDKTKSRWGKSRPYFLWMALPYGVISVLIFSSPGFSAVGKVIWAYATYFLYDLVYTAINLPLASILPSMTADSHERTKLNATRMFLGRTGGMIVSLSVLPLVALFGKGNEIRGFQSTMIVFGAVGTLMFLLTFFFTRERVTTGTETVKLKDSFKAIGRNGPWWILLVVNFAVWIGISMQQASLLYYFKYVLNAPKLASAFMPLGFLATLVGITLAPLFTKRIGKRNCFLIGNGIAVLGMSGMLAVGAGSVPFLFVFGVLSYLGTGLGNPLIYSMLADTVDYGEYISGVRAPGLLFSASSFGVKCGMGIGAGLCALILSQGRYLPNVQQGPSALDAIRLNFLGVPLLVNIAISVILFFYRLDAKHKKIVAALEQQRGKPKEELLPTVN